MFSFIRKDQGGEKASPREGASLGPAENGSSFASPPSPVEARRESDFRLESPTTSRVDQRDGAVRSPMFLRRIESPMVVDTTMPNSIIRGNYPN